MNDRSAKSFSISCARARVALLLLLVLAVVAGPAAGKKKKDRKPTDPAELFNPLLGVEYSHWLVGPIAHIAQLEEIEEYLAAPDDAAAEALIAEFWSSRAEGYGPFEKKPRQIYEQRAEEADKRYTLGAYPGRRTDRGTILIVYGEPEDIDFRTPNEIDEPYLEVWTYPKDAEPGLDGEKPERQFRFTRLDDGRTVFYTNQKIRDPRRLPGRRF